MSNEYPLMLYKDNLSNYAIANDDDDYSKYMDKGYTTHDNVKDKPATKQMESTAENAELKQKPAAVEGVVSYDEMTSTELQALLKQRGVKFKTRDNKDALVTLANDSE